jgi:hypothetical protein
MLRGQEKHGAEFVRIRVIKMFHWALGLRNFFLDVFV